MEGIIRHNRPDETSGREGYGIEFTRLISDSPDVIEHAMELPGGSKSLEQIAAIKTPDGVTQYEIDAHVLTGEHPVR